MAWLVAIVIAVKLRVLQDLISSRERRRQLLTWALILIGVAALGAGLYRLGMQQAPSILQVDLDKVIRERDAAAARIDGLERESNAIKSAVDEVRRQKDLANRELQELRNRPTPTPPIAVTGSPMGPKSTMAIISLLTASAPNMGVQSPNPKDSQWALVFSPKEDGTAALIIALLATAGLDIQPVPLADRNLHPEAPDLSPSADTGITLHGNSALSKRLFEALQPCMVVHHREKTPANLQQWYGRSAPDRQVVWIEIGTDPIWTMDKRCWI